MIRQGDVLLVPVDMPYPQDASVVNEVVLAEGEITGHAHRLKAEEILEWDRDGQKYVMVTGEEAGLLSHEDHDPTPVAVVTPNQPYKVVIQQTWNLEGQWRQVRD